jgi:hypothetical protein
LDCDSWQNNLLDHGLGIRQPNSFQTSIADFSTRIFERARRTRSGNVLRPTGRGRKLTTFVSAVGALSSLS